MRIWFSVTFSTRKKYYTTRIIYVTLSNRSSVINEYFLLPNIELYFAINNNFSSFKILHVVLNLIELNSSISKTKDILIRT